MSARSTRASRRGRAARALRTSEIAQALGVHANTVRLYEAWGYLPPIPRGANGYRQFCALHLEQARLVHLALRWPYLGDKALLIDLVKRAAAGDLGMALELAYQYLARVRTEITYAEAAVEFLEHWAAGHLIDTPQEPLHIGQAAAYLGVTRNTLRHWERNGLLEVPRDATNGYRLYGTAEFGRVRVIRTLVQAGYSLMAILRMLREFDAGRTNDLRAALDLPLDLSAEEEPIQTVADRWLATLHELEQRSQAMIRQIGRMLELVHAAQ